ncbi:deoxynucleotidyltransferase terminal-interacting protein 2-like [Schistocerca gregaria]|uniref:deoxynucleotidyltransferase terminal-interacting protein 2-like n=1 Tax=Schistocerca gregaria TaxID=7010 RepID=UPI00211ED86F|nr:deoxynucleotidyltransferase terminal-interacting protein 2-like [Schistocerca gregaria]
MASSLGLKMREVLRTRLSYLLGSDQDRLSIEEPNAYLDPTVDQSILYLDMAKWFPNSLQLLPNVTSYCLKESQPSKDSIFPDAEMKRLTQFLKKDRTVGIEHQAAMPPPPRVSQLRKEAAKKRAMTAGKDWYNLSQPVMTEELKQELAIAEMAHYADPKRMKKANAKYSGSKFFEVGTVVAPASDFYSDPVSSSSSGVPKSKSTLGFADTILHDQESRQFIKRKLRQLREKKAKNWRLQPWQKKH